MNWWKPKRIEEIYLMTCKNCKLQYFDLNSPAGVLFTNGIVTVCPRCFICGGIVTKLKSAIVTTQEEVKYKAIEANVYRKIHETANEIRKKNRRKKK